MEEKRKYHLTKPHRDIAKRKKRDKKIYQFYVDFLFKNGRTPTLEEIGEKFKFSRIRAGQIMERLAEGGYLLKLKRFHHPYTLNPVFGFGDKKGRKIVDLESKKS